MQVKTRRVRIPKTEEGDIVDMSGMVQKEVDASGMGSGSATVFVPGSTAAVTTLEHEPGLLGDVPAALERLFPKGIAYAHDGKWHDGNGHSHVRASFIGPSLVVPFSEGKLLLGTWQQVVLIELDNKPRNREIIVQISGE